MKKSNGAASYNDTFHKINYAANTQYAHAIPVLIQFLGYRQRVAQDLLRSQGTINEADLSELYENTNEEIKRILNL